MNNDQSIEQEIQAKGLITPDDIEANIESEFYFKGWYGAMRFVEKEGVPAENVVGSADKAKAALSSLTFCVLVLKNGFTVTGESACASPENFDTEHERKIARQKAVEKIWPLMGYELRTKLSRPVLTDSDALADLNGTRRPDNHQEEV